MTRREGWFVVGDVQGRVFHQAGCAAVIIERSLRFAPRRYAWKVHGPAGDIGNGMASHEWIAKYNAHSVVNDYLERLGAVTAFEWLDSVQGEVNG